MAVAVAITLGFQALCAFLAAKAGIKTRSLSSFAIAGCAFLLGVWQAFAALWLLGLRP